MAYGEISQDPKVGTDQSKEQFWEKVASSWSTLCRSKSEASSDSLREVAPVALTSRWTILAKKITLWLTAEDNIDASEVGSGAGPEEIENAVQDRMQLNALAIVLLFRSSSRSRLLVTQDNTWNNSGHPSLV